MHSPIKTKAADRSTLTFQLRSASKGGSEGCETFQPFLVYLKESRSTGQSFPQEMWSFFIRARRHPRSAGCRVKVACPSLSRFGSDGEHTTWSD